MDGMITANRLSDGVVVFLDAEGDWSEDFHRGAVQNDEAGKAAALQTGAQAERDNRVVGAYWIALEKRGGHLVPAELREAIRACGPTNRRDLGKQAHGQAPELLQRASAEF